MGPKRDSAVIKNFTSACRNILHGSQTNFTLSVTRPANVVIMSTVTALWKLLLIGFVSRLFKWMGSIKGVVQCKDRRVKNRGLHCVITRYRAYNYDKSGVYNITAAALILENHKFKAC